jgi:hypothetical protein
MPHRIESATAEQIVDTVDACVLAGRACDRNFVADFLDIPVANAEKALIMAEQLGFLRQANPGLYEATSPTATYLVSCVPVHRPAIFRFLLEQFPPYSCYKDRIRKLGNADQAARQVKSLLGLTAHRTDIAATLNNFGTYAGSLTYGAGAQIALKEDSKIDYLSVAAEIMGERESAKIYVLRRLGDQAHAFVDEHAVLDHLITAYQQAANVSHDARAPIVNAANAVESFLVQLAGKHHVNLTGATGINAKVDRLTAVPARLSGKHKNIFKYLGHLRNAADHGIDPEIGAMWTISESTAVEYVHVAMSAIAGAVAFDNQLFVV